MAGTRIPKSTARVAEVGGILSSVWYRWFAYIEKLIGGVATAGTGLTTTTDGELTVASNGITNAMLAQGPALSVIGVGGNATADRDDIEASADCMFLQRDRNDTVSFRYPQVPVFDVASVPDAAALGSGTLIYVYNEVGGATIAFSDGASWRRVQDRAVVS